MAPTTKIYVCYVVFDPILYGTSAGRTLHSTGLKNKPSCMHSCETSYTCILVCNLIGLIRACERADQGLRTSSRVPHLTAPERVLAKGLLAFSRQLSYSNVMSYGLYRLTYILRLVTQHTVTFLQYWVILRSELCLRSEPHEGTGSLRVKISHDNELVPSSRGCTSIRGKQPNPSETGETL